jgi:hypothetical protein
MLPWQTRTPRSVTYYNHALHSAHMQQRATPGCMHATPLWTGKTCPQRQQRWLLVATGASVTLQGVFSEGLPRCAPAPTHTSLIDYQGQALHVLFMHTTLCGCCRCQARKVPRAAVSNTSTAQRPSKHSHIGCVHSSSSFLTLWFLQLMMLQLCDYAGQPILLTFTY